MQITLINPNIVMQKNDFFGSGIPYMPFNLAYLASYLISKGQRISLIDSFGINPKKIISKGDFLYQGIEVREIISRIPFGTDFICVSAERLVAHQNVTDILKAIKRKFSQPIIVTENSQAVTSYSLKEVAKEIFEAGADYIVLGSSPINFFGLVKEISKKSKKNKTQNISIPNVLFKDKRGNIIETKKEYLNKNLNDLPFPAWEKFPLNNYWDLGYSHAPLSSKKYLPLLTSRGCPMRCNFCVVPGLNDVRWTSRQAKNIVDEMEYFVNKLGVKEFHLEDLNPTILKSRMVEMSKEILARRLDVVWKIGSGTKIETLDKETIFWMNKAGCKYLSFSPESGSSNVLRLMSKGFKHELALNLLKYMSRLGMSTQACFVLGFPGETDKDRVLTKKYIKKLVQNGVGEVALFIITPAPGSTIFKEGKFEQKAFGERRILGKSPKSSRKIDINKFTFSPKWRKDYLKLHKFRRDLYLYFALWKSFYNPTGVLKQIIGFIKRNFKTKMEMTIFRFIKINLLFYLNKLKK